MPHRVNVPAVLIASMALVGCYQTHERPDAGAPCSADAGARCLIDRPCWCRIGEDGLAHCFACLDDCGPAGDIHAGECEIWP